MMKCESTRVKNLMRSTGIDDQMLRVILPHIGDILNPNPRIRIHHGGRSNVSVTTAPTKVSISCVDSWEIEIVAAVSIMEVRRWRKCQLSSSPDEILKISMDVHHDFGLWERHTERELKADVEAITLPRLHETPSRIHVISITRGDLITLYLPDDPNPLSSLA